MTMVMPAGLEQENKREKQRRGSGQEGNRLRVSRFHALIMDSARHKMGVGTWSWVWLFLGSGVSGVDFICTERMVGKKARGYHRQVGRGNEGQSTKLWLYLQIVRVLAPRT